MTLSLRASMLLVLAVGAPTAWKVNRARAQRDAVEAVMRMDGPPAAGRVRLLFDDQYTDGHEVPGGSPRGPAWLRRRLGDEYFREVTAVSLFWTPPAPGRLRPLAAFPRLEWLELGYFHPTERELDQIAGLGRLRELDLPGLNDAGLAHLAGLTELRRLFVHGSAITDAGLSHLAAMAKLEKLSLSITDVTDAGLAKVAALGALRELDLSATRVGDAGMAHVGRMRRLRALDLSGTRVGDAGRENSVSSIFLTSFAPFR